MRLRVSVCKTTITPTQPSKPASGTSVGKGGGGGGDSGTLARASSGGGAVRRSAGRGKKGGASAPRVNAGLMAMRASDSAGLQVGPMTVLVMSLVFIAFVFFLHIWGKMTK